MLGIKAFNLAKILEVEEDFLDTAEGEHMHDDSVSSVSIEFEGAMDLALLNGSSQPPACARLLAKPDTT